MGKDLHIGVGNTQTQAKQNQSTIDIIGNIYVSRHMDPLMSGACYTVQQLKEEISQARAELPIFYLALSMALMENAKYVYISYE